MRRNLCIGSVCAAVLATAWLGACGKQQTLTGPTSGLVITAPANVKYPGQTGQFTAQEVLADNSKTDVTAMVAWSSSNQNVATISATGFVTLIAVGTTTITARLSSGLSGTYPLNVLSPEPLSGRVFEAGGFALAQVQVTIVGGSKDGVVTQTDQNGQYVVANASGAEQVRAAKDGYITATVSVFDPTQVNITLNPTTPYADLHGSWHLTFSASSSCQLPDEAMTRKYTAAIDQDNARLTIRLSDAQFGVSRSTPENWIFGRVAGNNVSLTLGNSDDSCFYYGMCLVEQLADGRSLSLSGTAGGSLNGGLLATVLAGAVNFLDSQTNRPIATCTAADHHLTFTR